MNFRICSKVDCGCQFASLIPLGNGFWRIRLWNVTIRSIIILIVSWGFYSPNWVCDSPRDHGQKVQGDLLWLLLGLQWYNQKNVLAPNSKGLQASPLNMTAFKLMVSHLWSDVMTLSMNVTLEGRSNRLLRIDQLLSH